MNISELLARNARKYPQQEALVSPRERLNYQELNVRVNRLAHALQNCNFKQGDRAVIVMPNTNAFVIAYFAVMRLGGIVVPVNAKSSRAELEYMLDDSGANVLFVHELLFEELKEATFPPHLVKIKTGERVTGWQIFGEMINRSPETEIRCRLKEDDDASILYTSGTTGKPKGVLFTNRNILSAAWMMCVEMAMKPESRILHMMPLSHSAPLHLFLVAGMVVGATHVLSPVFTPEALVETVEKERITHFFGAPVAYLFTAKLPNLQDYDLSTMKYWVYGGAPLSRPEVVLIQKAFRSDRLVCVYGLTEAGPNGTLLLPEEHAEKAGSIGKRAALGMEIRLVNEKGEDVAAGEVGEIALYGESVMKGYFRKPEETNRVFQNGWLLTGDMARKDEEGYYWVVDRKKDMILSGGVNVYPKEIEDVLVTHPKIREVSVIGVPHPEWGETVKAFLVLVEPMDNIEEECKRFLKGKLASYKIPKLYERIEELPRNATGKIQKQVLRGMANELLP